MVLDSTPMRHLPNGDLLASMPEDMVKTIKALSALAISRRNLVQLFTLCSFVLLVQLGWSLRLELKLARRRDPSTTASSGSADKEGSEQVSGSRAAPNYNAAFGAGTYWLRKGELRRNLSVIALAFLVTGGCIVVKIVTAIIGHGVWSGESEAIHTKWWTDRQTVLDMSPSDIVLATLFYQFSLYVCVRLARRGFTLGELALVCNAATALFMEVINLTRMKVSEKNLPCHGDVMF